MAGRILDKSKLGVEKDVFKKTEIRFIEESSPLVGFINSVILEDNRDNIKVIKDGNNNRPYLVLYNPILHAKIAYYMTSSVTNPQKRIENKIWGHHYIKTPDMIYNYLENSSLKGKVDRDKLHVIDKDRFLFVTDDSMKDVESRAVRAEDINISMFAHYNNAAEINEFIKQDLNPEQFAKIVLQGKKERWVYNRKIQNPVIYSPTAMYLLLYLNGMNQYQNRKLRATPELLEVRKKTVLEVIDGISEYIRQDEKLKKLQKESSLTYKVYKSARYYNTLPERTFKGMEALDNLDVSYFGAMFVTEEDLKEYANICGHPQVNQKLHIEERIELELDRFKVKDKKQRECIKAQILELLSEEAKLQKKLSKTAGFVIEDLNRNPRENLDLSSYPLDPELLPSLKEIALNKESMEQVKEFATVYYDNLSIRFINEVNERNLKKRNIQAIKEEKEQTAEYERLANEYALFELSTIINKKYFGSFDSTFRQFEQGYLIPKPQDMKEFESLVDEIRVGADDGIVIGTKLYDKLRADLIAINKFNDRIKSSLFGLKSEIEKLDSILETKEGKLASELFSSIETINAKTKVRCAGKAEGEKLAETKKAVKDLLNLELNPASIQYTSISLDEGSTERELLATIQAIANYKAELRGFYNIKSNKMKLISALKEINSGDVIASYTQTVNLVRSLDASYLDRPDVVKPRAIADMSRDVDELVRQITSGKLTNNGYIKLEEQIYSHLTHMKNFILSTNGRIKEKENLDKALSEYAELIKGAREQILTLLNEGKEEYLGELREDLEDYFEKEKAKYNQESVELYDEKGRVKRIVSGEEFKAGSVSYNERAKEFLDIERYLKPAKDEELAYKLFDKIFPSKEVIMAEIDRKLSKCNSPREANKLLKAEIEKIGLVDGMLTTFMQTTLPDIYVFSINSAKDVYNNKITWQEQLESFRFPEIKRENFDIDEDVFNQNVLALEATYQEIDLLKEETDNEFRAYQQAFYKAVEEIIDKMPYRTDLKTAIDAMLRSSYGQKGKIEVMAPMPSAIIGDNGITEKMGAYIHTKIKLINAFDDVLQDIKNITEYHLSQNDNKSFVEIIDELPIRSPEYKRVKTQVLDRIVKVMNDVSDSYWGEDEEESSILESLRLFALRGEDEKNFLIQKNGLTKTFKTYQLGVKKGILGRVVNNPSIREITHRLTVDVLNEIPKLKTMIREGNMDISCGVEDEVVTEMLERFYNLFYSESAFE